ncbi:MAG: adenylate/guanylate cyclase domain-containing protein [Thermodesulfobacteriota bacterium]
MLTFRTKLILFALLLTLIASVPAVILLGQRPWDELRRMIAQSEMLLSSVRAAVPEADLAAVNAFVLEAVRSVPEHAVGMGTPLDETAPEDFTALAPGMAFYLLLDLDRLPPGKEIREIFAEAKVNYADFDYALLSAWYDFWMDQFVRRPETLAAFRRTRDILVKTATAAEENGLAVVDLYLMLDVDAIDAGYFARNLAYVLESLPCWDAVFPGQPFDMVKNNSESWRTSYHPARGGRPGYHHNRIHDPENGYLPEFDTDEWGSWFTVWLAPEPLGANPAVFTLFNVDFDAGAVVAMMRRIAVGLIFGAVLVLLLLIVTASVISRRLTRPIRDLTAGVDAVMARRFDHRVPCETGDEFRHLIEVFNRMILSVKHMVNLKDALTRILSEELAERAAEKGLTLGGQQVECSVMFTDFAGFSTLTSHMPAEKVVGLLNHYFEALIPIIKKWGGFPDKYIGDAIVAIFGAPIQLDDHAERAVRCAVEMQRKMRELNRMLDERGEAFFFMRIGINTGEVVVGAIGCDLKLEFTSIGEATNLANRMESVCPIGHVMISAATMDRCRGRLPDGVTMPETPEEVMVKGYEKGVSAYPIWIDGLRIEKLPAAENARDFYRLSREE